MIVDEQQQHTKLQRFLWLFLWLFDGAAFSKALSGELWGFSSAKLTVSTLGSGYQA